MRNDDFESVPKPNGTVIITDVDGREFQGDTLQCCHCMKHWLVVRGSGRRRGFCQKCGRVTCGRPECGECVPNEKQLDLAESGKIIIAR